MLELLQPVMGEAVELKVRMQLPSCEEQSRANWRGVRAQFDGIRSFRHPTATAGDSGGGSAPLIVLLIFSFASVTKLPEWR